MSANNKKSPEDLIYLLDVYFCLWFYSVATQNYPGTKTSGRNVIQHRIISMLTPIPSNAFAIIGLCEKTSPKQPMSTSKIAQKATFSNNYRVVKITIFHSASFIPRFGMCLYLN